MILTELETWLEYSHSPHYPGDPKSESSDIWFPRPDLAHEFKLDYFESYLVTMEGFLEQKQLKIKEEVQEYRSWVQSETTARINKLKEDIKTGRISSDPKIVSRYEHQIYQDAHDMGDPEEFWLKATNEFSATFRESFFVNLYSFWESQLFPLCASLEHYDDYSTVGLGDARGFQTKHAKPFLQKMGFPLDTKTWSDINCYRILRNCFVHHDGNLGRMEKADKRKLEILILSNSTLLALNGKKPERYRDIFLSERDAIIVREGKARFHSKRSISIAEEFNFKEGDIVLWEGKIAIFAEDLTLQRGRVTKGAKVKSLEEEEKIIFREGKMVVCGMKEKPKYNNGDGVILRQGENVIFRQKFIFSEFANVTLCKGFCEKALETIGKYFYDLLDTLASLDSIQRAS